MLVLNIVAYYKVWRPTSNPLIKNYIKRWSWATQWILSTQSSGGKNKDYFYSVVDLNERTFCRSHRIPTLTLAVGCIIICWKVRFTALIFFAQGSVFSHLGPRSFRLLWLSTHIALCFVLHILTHYFFHLQIYYIKLYYHLTTIFFNFQQILSSLPLLLGCYSHPTIIIRCLNQIEMWRYHLGLCPPRAGQSIIITLSERDITLAFILKGVWYYEERWTLLWIFLTGHPVLKNSVVVSTPITDCPDAWWSSALP